MADRPDYRKADIGIVSALPMELEAFLRRCQHVNHYKDGGLVFRGGRYDDVRVAIVECGAGFARARHGAEALLKEHAPGWLLSCGFSGALQPGMKRGEIVMADSIVDQHGHSLSTGLTPPAQAQAGLYTGRLLTADAIVRTVAEKSALAEKHQAIAVDMESLAVAQVARDHKVRFMAVRVISDDMSRDLPNEVLSVLGSTGAVRIGAALGAIVKRPGSYREMMALRSDAQAASAALAEFLDGVVLQLSRT